MPRPGRLGNQLRSGASESRLRDLKPTWNMDPKVRVNNPFQSLSGASSMDLLHLGAIGISRHWTQKTFSRSVVTRMLFGLLVLDILLPPCGADPPPVELYNTAFLQESCKCSAVDHLRCTSFTLAPRRFGAGNVALARNQNFFKEFYCQFVIRAPRRQDRILLMVNEMDIPDTKGCNAGMLKIFDGLPGERPLQLAGLCGRSGPGVSFRSNTDKVTLSYHQTHTILRQPKSFNLTFTYFRVGGKDLQLIPSGTDPCNTSNTFNCLNGLCISSNLECDHYNNCGDNSDESMDYHICGKLLTSSDPAVGLAVGCSMACLLIVVMVILVTWGMKKRKGPFFSDPVNSSIQNGITQPPPQEFSSQHHTDCHQMAPVMEPAPCYDSRTAAERGSRRIFSNHDRMTSPAPTAVIYENGNVVTLSATNARHVLNGLTGADDASFSDASSTDLYAMGLHRHPPPPSYSQLFPDTR